jgi:hypothetical protein
MKYLLSSAGVLALGAAALHAYDPEMTRQRTGRPWTVAATVRGFYDDNTLTSPDGREVESFGVELSPSAHLHLPLEQTFIALGYVYSLKWYDDRPDRDTDQAHEFNAKLRHQFSPRHDIGLDNSFVFTSEPTVVDQRGIITTPLRTESDILHNRAAIEYNALLTQVLGLSLGYVNNWYDYEQENNDVAIGFGSRSALLDRMEHLFRADARYTFNPNLVGLVGYQFGITEYTGDELILPGIMSDIRDTYSHYIYAGVDYDLTARLRASLRAGGRYTDFHEAGESAVSPYADASLTYVYLPGSSLQVGVRHDRHATDISAVDRSGTPTLDAQATAVYAQLQHRITSRLSGTLLGQYQISEFNEGDADGDKERIYLIGINFDYRFNRHWSAEVGYNFDMVESDVPRDYERNRVYVGVRATY